MTGNPYLRDNMEMKRFRLRADIDSNSIGELDQLRESAKKLTGKELHALRKRHAEIRRHRMAKIAGTQP